MKLFDFLKKIPIKFSIKQHPINATEIDKQSKENFLKRFWDTVKFHK